MCVYIVACEIGKFQCANSDCTWYSFVCDKQDDCRDNSDETMCSDGACCNASSRTLL